ncbi:MAG: cytochrome c-type biogenesis CcmF C-terminal domain-containing protein [Myxococcota bacterium]|nr:cytochrome c-type biogenesis CcmF C-terminal domain-containing protein [Myxococcota bacterium]
MDWFGQLMICLAVVFSAAGAALVLVGNFSSTHLRAGKYLLYAAAAASAVSLLVLVFLFLTHDYRVSYVRDYADRTMSVSYLIMAVWGGQEGSLLLWASLQTFFTAGIAARSFGKNRDLVPTALAVLAIIQLFFLCLTLFHSNPFTPLGTVATRGNGLNPLLRNPYMAFHPPTLFLGYVGFSVPMAFALAALIERRDGRDWTADIRFDILFAWIFLGIGNVLGMVWAYEELGWGGYWGWDPVENASFMPWLTGTALLHSSIIAKNRKGFRAWCPVLTWLTFVLIIFGTFLTRSNIIASVHAFAGATTGPYFLGLIASVTALFFGLLAWQWRSLTAGQPKVGVVSRDGIFYLTNVAFVGSAAFVWLATMTPFFTELIRGEKVAVTPAFFNRWMVPFGLLILGLIGVCHFFKWRDKTVSPVLRSGRWPLIIGAVTAVIASLIGKGLIWQTIVSAFLLGMVGTTVLREIVRLQRRARTGAQQRGATNRRLGGQLVHLAVVLLFVGFTGAAYTVEQTANLGPGQPMRVGDYTLTFLGIRQDNTVERHALLADLEVRQGTTPIGVLSPARHLYHSHPGRPTSEVVIHTGLTEDLFLILGEGDPVRGRAIIRAVVNPLVVWIWLGGGLMVLGTAIALTQASALERFVGSIKATPRKFALGLGIVVLALLVGLISGLARDLATGIAGMTGVGLTAVAWLFGDALVGFATGKEAS